MGCFLTLCMLAYVVGGVRHFTAWGIFVSVFMISLTLFSNPFHASHSIFSSSYLSSNLPLLLYLFIFSYLHLTSHFFSFLFSLLFFIFSKLFNFQSLIPNLSFFFLFSFVQDKKKA